MVFTMLAAWALAADEDAAAKAYQCAVQYAAFSTIEQFEDKGEVFPDDYHGTAMSKEADQRVTFALNQAGKDPHVQADLQQLIADADAVFAPIRKHSDTARVQRGVVALKVGNCDRLFGFEKLRFSKR